MDDVEGWQARQDWQPAAAEPNFGNRLGLGLVGKHQLIITKSHTRTDAEPSSHCNGSGANCMPNTTSGGRRLFCFHVTIFGMSYMVLRSMYGTA